MSTYVTSGAKLKCSFGNKESALNAADKEIYINNKNQANIMDFKPNINIFSFGMCSSLANPVVATATALNNGILKKMPCIPLLTAPWIYGKIDVHIQGFPALLDCSKNMCMWGGVITITSHGQNVPINMEIKEGLAKRPTDRNKRITIEQIRNELKKSNVGKETLEYIDKYNITVILSYEPMRENLGNGLTKITYGKSIGNLVKTYITNTKTIERTAQNIIHEITHIYYTNKGERATKREELICRIRQEKHPGDKKVPLSTMRKHIKNVYNPNNLSYKNLPNK